MRDMPTLQQARRLTEYGGRNTRNTWKNYMEVIMNQDGDVNSNSEDMVTEIDEILADHA